MSDWQTIETAPDNDFVLVFCPDASEHTRIMICARYIFTDDPHAPDWCELSTDKSIDVEPTHWMPLPSPPAAS